MIRMIHAFHTTNKEKDLGQAKNFQDLAHLQPTLKQQPKTGSSHSNVTRKHEKSRLNSIRVRSLLIGLAVGIKLTPP